MVPPAPAPPLDEAPPLAAAPPPPHALMVIRTPTETMNDADPLVEVNVQLPCALPFPDTLVAPVQTTPLLASNAEVVAHNRFHCVLAVVQMT